MCLLATSVISSFIQTFGSQEWFMKFEGSGGNSFTSPAKHNPSSIAETELFAALPNFTSSLVNSLPPQTTTVSPSRIGCKANMPLPSEDPARTSIRGSIQDFEGYSLDL